MSKRKKAVDHNLARGVVESARARGDEEYLLHKPLIVAVSGGPDSLALLHLLRALRGALTTQSLHVAHLDHGFRGEESAEDARFVASLAAMWGLPHTVKRFDVPAYARERRLSPEDAARKARYAFLAGLAHRHSATVAVAHTADDQAETVLMNILRGTGISGLSGMQPISTLPVAQNDSALLELGGA